MAYREQIAIDKGLDNTIAFLLEGYTYISNRTKRYNRNIFETRLLGGKKTICMTGKDAAEIFYDEEKFRRQGAAPKRVLKTLFGENGVQTLDDPDHRHRKELFMSLMSPEQLKKVSTIVRGEWVIAIDEWEEKELIILYEEAKKILTRTACKWAGVPLLKKDEQKITQKLSSLYEAGGAIGTRHWKGRINRQYCEQWMEQLILAVRDGRMAVAEETALYLFAFHEDMNGNVLEPKIAAVEMLNILRPIVAIAVYIAFCALALHEHPEAKGHLENGSGDDYQIFVQEVRRYYPFFPIAAAKVCDDFLWYGHDFKKDTLVLLDLYGTNHDPEVWGNPDIFNPDRFNGWNKNPFAFIPQGGGDYYKNHRCPGEWLTIDVMQASMEMLIHHMTYDVPKQNLQYSMIKMPSTPKSGFIIGNVQKR